MAEGQMTFDKLPVVWTGLSKEQIEKFDVLDADQIELSIKGRIIDQFFYEFEQWDPNKHQKVLQVGISYAGIKWIASQMAARGDPITCWDASFTDTPETYRCVVKARRYATGEDRMGAFEQPRFYTDKEGKQKPNPFAFTLVLSKAQRNAIRQFIPEPVIQEGYREWKLKQKGSPPLTVNAPKSSV